MHDQSLAKELKHEVVSDLKTGREGTIGGELGVWDILQESIHDGRVGALRPKMVDEDLEAGSCSRGPQLLKSIGQFDDVDEVSNKD